MVNILKLNNILSRTRSAKRVGRGGTYGGRCGRGSNGQKSRETVKTEGGQYPTYLRYKKRGFVHTSRIVIQAITLKNLYDCITKHKLDGIITICMLRKLFKIKSSSLIKIIGTACLNNEQMKVFTNVKVETHFVSGSLCKSNFIIVLDEKQHNQKDSK